MVHPLTRRPHTLAAFTTTLAVLAALCQASDAQAAEQQARLSLQVKLTRSAGTVHGGSVAQAGDGMRGSTTLDYAVTLVSDGVPGVANPLDVADTGRQLAAAQVRQARVDNALQRSATRQAALARDSGRPATAPATPATPDLATLQAQAQAMLARCGQDQDCLMREAARLSTAQLAAPAPGQGGRGTLSAGDRAKLEGYAEAWRACERQHPAGTARNACQDQARVRAGGTVDASDHDDSGPATPYLSWRSTDACQAHATLVMDERTEGHFQDVQGTVAFVSTRQARSAPAQALPCGVQQLVVDQRSGRVWGAAALMTPTLRGQSTRQEAGRPLQRHDSQATAEWYEAADWLHERLNRLTRQGSDEAVLPLRQAQGDGQRGELRIQLRWQFQPL